MAIRWRFISGFLLFTTLFVVFQTACSVFIFPAPQVEQHFSITEPTVSLEKKIPDSIDIRVSTFLGNEKRNYYGDSASDKLNVIWKTFLGKGTTIVTAKKGVEEWFGAGWTGQPLVVKEKNKTWLIQGAFDHNLKKIDAATGEVTWNYSFDDILKGTGTIWKNDSAKDPQNRIVIMQGSRKGVDVEMCSGIANSFRAVSFFTGKEVWRFNVKHTASYSRDCDASALVVNDTAYIGLENGKFISFDPGKETQPDDSVFHPRVFSEEQLYNNEDAAKHGGNLVTESSPARIGDHVYITAGSGHVYGYSLTKKIIDWDFYIGSDLDGTPVVTSDSCILIPVEKQYITGNGGIFKLDPKKDPAQCVQWYFPTGDLHFADWEGGVVGSVAVNDFYNKGGDDHLAAFTGIDGELNVVQYDRIEKDSMSTGPDGKTKYPVPVLRYHKHIGSSISTPIFVQDHLIAAGYSGIYLFSYSANGNFFPLDFHPGIFEASPVANGGKIFIASRDGYLYCFGDTLNNAVANSDEKQQKEIAGLVTPVFIEKNKKSARPETNEDYSLIAGVFRQKSNADLTLRTWRTRGYLAELEKNGDLYYVSVSKSSSVDSLSSVAADVQAKFHADTWIRK
ncbi:MAG: PQQ-binding-like beta-propeller repeat protein [Bacteroidetes bacterium]|nr:PQQ-binding-like beta-propeller repeat protein [Bacteroidota bacterium]